MAVRVSTDALGGRFPLAEVRGHVESDLAAHLYATGDLEAWLDDGGTCAYPSHLKRVVPAHAAEKRQAAFATRLRNLAGLTRAVHVGPGGAGQQGASGAGAPRVATVVYRDPEAGLLVLEESVGGNPGATAEDLRTQIAALRPPLLGGAHERALRERLAAVESGRPDSAQRPPEKRRIEVRSTEALQEWHFEKAVVPGVAASVRRDRLLARLRDIQECGLLSAWRQGADGNRIEATVDFIDLKSPALFLREFIAGPRGPFPGQRITLTSLNEIAGWTFGPQQGTFFPLGAPPAKAAGPANVADVVEHLKPNEREGRP